MKLPRAQFGHIANNFSTLTEANMAVYVVFRDRTLQGGYRTGVQGLLKGQATMFTNQTSLNFGRGTAFRKVLVDLETMKVLLMDPAWGRGVPLSEMVEACKELENPPG